MIQVEWVDGYRIHAKVNKQTYLGWIWRGGTSEACSDKKFDFPRPNMRAGMY